MKTAELQTFAGCDSIVTLILEVEMTFTETQNIALNIGEEYSGIPIFSDTTIIENFIAQNNCDSMVTTYISVLTSVRENLLEELNLTVYPNPTSGSFFIRFELPKTIELKIKARDIMARKITYESKNETFTTGTHTIEIDASEWASGVYLFQIISSEGTAGVRIVRE